MLLVRPMTAKSTIIAGKHCVSLDAKTTMETNDHLLQLDPQGELIRFGLDIGERLASRWFYRRV